MFCGREPVAKPAVISSLQYKIASERISTPFVDAGVANFRLGMQTEDVDDEIGRQLPSARAG
jgi:hypothetical protein